MATATVTRVNRGIGFTLAAIALLAVADATETPGQPRTDGAGIEQVWVPAGSFLMGTNDPGALEPPAWAQRELASEQPVHVVTISSGFWIDRYEVTNAAYQVFVDDGGYDDRSNWSTQGWRWLLDARAAGASLPDECVEPIADHPRACVTWYEAAAYARWRGGRLPTEAEWEYAARGPLSLTYPWGDEFDPARANVVDSTSATAVGSFPTGASWVGALDMAGNVMEWVLDWLDPGYYASGDHRDPTGPATGRIKVEKGGWWGANPYVARSAYRHFEDPPEYSDHHIGFRVVTPAGAPTASAEP